MRKQTVVGTGIRNSRMALAVVLAGAGAASPAMAQWKVVNLHPAWASWSEALGVRDGQQVGFAGVTRADALLWTGTADSAVILDPTPAQQAAATCVMAGIQGGWSEVAGEERPWEHHAGLWSGTSESFVDLHPAGATNSEITAMDGDTQVGVWFPEGEGGLFTLARPCLWRGTPESFVDLTPPGVTAAEVHGVSGNMQVGSNHDNFLAQACMWQGTPDSYVSLQPATALFSIALCTDGERQYGAILTWDGKSFESARTEVGYWSGTPDSWVNLTPPDMYGAAITGVDGDRQVGAMAADPIGNAPFTAATWTGTVESFEDLHAYLPAGYSESTAFGVWHDAQGTAYVVGTAYNAELQRNEAVMWVSSGGCPADFNGSGEVDSQDFFDFLTAFFATAPNADFNADGLVNSQDFFDYLTAFFAGC